MKNSEVLHAARALLTPETWTKGAYARTKRGNKIDPKSPNATCWCALGALEKVTGRLRGGPVLAALESAGHGHIAGLNDTAVSVDEIHALFDKAIAAEEAAGR